MEKQNKDLIIQDLKDVIIDLNSKNKQQETIIVYLKKEIESILTDASDKIHRAEYDSVICKSANIRQSEIIKELQLENSEVNKLLKFRTQMINYVVIPHCIISVIYIVANLIK